MNTKLTIKTEGCLHRPDRQECDICRDKPLKRWLVTVLTEGCQHQHVWTVMASSRDDAIQLAFALDGGWGRERDASGMLELAKSYCEAEESRPCSNEPSPKPSAKSKAQLS
jgi:hypothetical protein